RKDHQRAGGAPRHLHAGGLAPPVGARERRSRGEPAPRPAGALRPGARHADGGALGLCRRARADTARRSPGNAPAARSNLAGTQIAGVAHMRPTRSRTGFTRFAKWTAKTAGRPVAFVAAVAIIALWGV